MPETILGVHVKKRTELVDKVQSLLTEYGCNIRTRIGLHEADNNLCSPSGLILLQMYGDRTKIEELQEKLHAIDGVEVKRMIFD